MKPAEYQNYIDSLSIDELLSIKSTINRDKSPVNYKILIDRICSISTNDNIQDLNKPKVISSRKTSSFKYSIFLQIVMTIFCFSLSFIEGNGFIGTILTTVLMIICIINLLKYRSKVETVEMDREFLYLSNTKHSIKVTKDKIDYIEENTYIRGRPIKIVFKESIIFGKSITFFPIGSFSLTEEHPIIEEIKGFSAI